MAVINNFEAPSVGGSAYAGSPVATRNVGGLGDGWDRDTTTEAAGVANRSRFRPIRQSLAGYIQPPRNAGDPSIRVETAADRVSAPWKWNSNQT